MCVWQCYRLQLLISTGIQVGNSHTLNHNTALSCRSETRRCIMAEIQAKFSTRARATSVTATMRRMDSNLHALMHACRLRLCSTKTCCARDAKSLHTYASTQRRNPPDEGPTCSTQHVHTGTGSHLPVFAPRTRTRCPMDRRHSPMTTSGSLGPPPRHRVVSYLPLCI